MGRGSKACDEEVQGLSAWRPREAAQRAPRWFAAAAAAAAEAKGGGRRGDKRAGSECGPIAEPPGQRGRQAEQNRTVTLCHRPSTSSQASGRQQRQRQHRPADGRNGLPPAGLVCWLAECASAAWLRRPEPPETRSAALPQPPAHTPRRGRAGSRPPSSRGRSAAATRASRSPPACHPTGGRPAAKQPQTGTAPARMRARARRAAAARPTSPWQQPGLGAAGWPPGLGPRPQLET